MPSAAGKVSPCHSSPSSLTVEDHGSVKDHLFLSHMLSVGEVGVLEFVFPAMYPTTEVSSGSVGAARAVWHVAVCGRRSAGFMLLMVLRVCVQTSVGMSRQWGSRPRGREPRCGKVSSTSSTESCPGLGALSTLPIREFICLNRWPVSSRVGAVCLPSCSTLSVPFLVTVFKNSFW